MTTVKTVEFFKMMQKIHDDFGMNYAVLQGKEVIPVENMEVWGKFFASDERILARDKINNSEVSTVFLGMNHGTKAYPLWFETMVFVDGVGGDCNRYATYDEALKGHQDMVNGLK
jgi:hypothetical protein